MHEGQGLAKVFVHIVKKKSDLKTEVMLSKVSKELSLKEEDGIIEKKSAYCKNVELMNWQKTVEI